MFDESIIKKTGQWWKAHLSFWGAVLGGAVMFFGLANLEKNNSSVVLVLVGIVIGLASSIFACVSIKCPNCKAKWAWHAVSKKSPNEWLNWLITQPKCPKCDYNKNT